MESKVLLAGVLGVMVLLSVVAAGFFLKSSTVTLADVTSFSFSTLKHKVLSVDFALFVVFLALTAGILGGAVASLEKQVIWAGGIGGLVLGILIASVAFGLFTFAIPMVALVAGAIFGVWSAGIKRTELKRFVAPRTAMALAGSLGMVLGVGLMMWGVVELMPQQSALADHFVDSMI
ncbi:MAG: hypothetical protein Q7R47_06590, partial [Candidatus Diapherotrites archaeon]|nr:hypothetical protein [Candidatus Diapherotrites archaeon]